MPRQIITLKLEGITAADYLSLVCDPEPAALGFGLTSLTIRAEPLGDTVEAILSWEDTAPPARVAAAAAGLRITGDVFSVEAAPLEAIPAPPRPAPRPSGRIAAMIDRAAMSMANRPWSPSIAPPAQLRWA